jgi:hypothetical protein
VMGIADWEGAWAWAWGYGDERYYAIPGFFLYGDYGHKSTYTPHLSLVFYLLKNISPLGDSLAGPFHAMKKERALRLYLCTL